MGRTGALSHLIAARVRAAIDASGESWASAAELSGVARETLRRKLTDTHPFNIDELEDIATALGLPRDYFLLAAQRTGTP
ncbi:helix-turn-helix domain-containing protein [Nocardia sp. NPDC057030]|uniref:helix-turn-helix domain-containing protein n=1 Tax=unclassified Nocardia TaxID=2637762 RepID=UPI003636C7CF